MNRPPHGRLVKLGHPMRALAVLSACLLTACSALAQTYSFSVKVVGHGKPVILIPGLTCTGDVWDGTVAQLKTKYQCHVLTLPGFGTQPPISGPYLSHVRDDIIAYVKAKKLDHPAVIGHSLGGFMVYYLAEKEPALWGRLVCVDGVPFLSSLSNPNATAEGMQTIADGVKKQLAAAPADQFKAGIRSTLEQQITDPKNVDAMYKLCSASSQANTAEAISEMLATDARGQEASIQSPLLLIGAAQFATTDDMKSRVEASYQSQIKDIPNGKVIMDFKSRHFIMLDDPDFFYRAIEDFLQAQ
jgi:N-formylmaleamate deformylase